MKYLRLLLLISVIAFFAYEKVAAQDNAPETPMMEKGIQTKTAVFAGGQFVDRGPQYRSVIFYADQDQRRGAEASMAALAASGQFDHPIVTEILPLGPFYMAEDYHQDYYKKNPVRYQYYR